MRTQKRATIADVAAKAGVSRTSVSRVLNGRGELSEETRDRVVLAIRELGYRPSEVARSLSSQKTYTVGVIVYDLLNPGLAEIVNSVQVELAREGYRTIVACMAGQVAAGETCLSLIEDRRVDGIIITNPLPDSDVAAPGGALSPELARTGTNCYHPSTRRVSRAKFDNLVGGQVAAAHLLGLGHHHIGVLVGPERWGNVDERLAGVRIAREQCSLPSSVTIVERATEWSIPAGYHATLRLLERMPSVTAILALYDLLAIGALRALSDRGKRVPDDVAVIGFNDEVFADYAVPRLSTVRANCSDMGKLAAQLLLDLLGDNDAEPREVIVPVQLVIRDSTAGRLSPLVVR